MDDVRPPGSSAPAGQRPPGSSAPAGQRPPGPSAPAGQRPPGPSAPAGQRPVVIAARRTPFGTAGAALRDVPVSTLAAVALRAVLAEANLGAAPARPDEVVLGNVMGPGGNPARIAALEAGCGDGVPGLTVDRQCGSGLEAITLAATLVLAGRAELVLAGGAESASTAPRRAANRSGEPQWYDRAPFAPPGWDDPEMGEAADRLAARFGVSRERQDAYAAGSHERARRAQAAGTFDAELVPVAGLGRDQRPRAGLTVERLARFPAAFGPGGTATAANSCGISDGAAMVAVVPERLRAGRPGLRLLDWQCSGGPAAEPGFGPVPATRALLARHHLTAADLGAVEITEAFAGQVLTCLDALGLDRERVCPAGGAIALGHPWAASGAALVVRLFTTMVRADGPALGLATCGIGGGLGLSLLVERV